MVDESATFKSIRYHKFDSTCFMKTLPPAIVKMAIEEFLAENLPEEIKD